MSDVDDFVAEIHPRLVAELRALHNGDPQPRLAMWSSKDPVTLFGAAMSGSGWPQASRIFRSIASRWSDSTDQRVEILAAGVSGDLAYTVELEHTSVSVDGVPVDPYTLRVTQVYRREDGEWKVIHRHGDRLPIEQRKAFPAKHQRSRKMRADVPTVLIIGHRNARCLRLPRGTEMPGRTAAGDLGTFIEETLGRRAGLAITQRESGRPG